MVFILLKLQIIELFFNIISFEIKNKMLRSKRKI